MPKDDKEMTLKAPPQELPMPKYAYQKPQGGSVSSAYRSEEERRREPVHQLQNVQFG